MTNLTLNIDSYLSEEDKAQIIHDEYSVYVRDKISKDHERIFSNAAHHICFNLVQKEFDEDISKIIAEKTKECIQTLSQYTVFKRKDYWEHEDSAGFILLNKVIDEQKNILESRVAEIFADIDVVDLKNQIAEIVSDTVFEALAKAEGKA